MRMHLFLMWVWEKRRFRLKWENQSHTCVLFANFPPVWVVWSNPLTFWCGFVIKQHFLSFLFLLSATECNFQGSNTSVYSWSTPLIPPYLDVINWICPGINLDDSGCWVMVCRDGNLTVEFRNPPPYIKGHSAAHTRRSHRHTMTQTTVRLSPHRCLRKNTGPLYTWGCVTGKNKSFGQCRVLQVLNKNLKGDILCTFSGSLF